jgi:molybdopterin synthase catalytic subunit
VADRTVRVPYVTHDAIDLAGVVAGAAGQGLGATVLFLGSVRRSAEDGPVEGIEYSAYEEMVGEEFARILDEAATRWTDARFAVQHRIGLVPAGEPSIAVAAAARHRAEAFEACRFIIDAAKQRLPVWKKELLDDGSARWREVDDPGTRVSGSG